MDKSVLEELFGRSPRASIITAFSDGIGDAWSKKEIQEMTGLSKATVLNNWAPLEEYGIIKVKKRFGNTKLFTLDTENITVKLLLKFEMALADYVAPKSEKKTNTKEAIPA